MKPHKHAELIKAWADGAEIQWVYATKGDGKKLWVVVDDPTWQESHEYRINLEPKPCNGFCGEQECKENQKNCERARMARKLLGSGTPQIKELSDEEIHKAEYQFMDWNRSLEQPLVKISSELYVFQQALAILKKASEK